MRIPKWGWAVVATVGSAIASEIVHKIIPAIPSLLSWLSRIATVAWGWLWDSHGVYGWAIVMFGALAFVGAQGLVGNLLEYLCKKSEVEWKKFVLIEYCGAVWTWRWEGLEIVDLGGVCPVCKGLVQLYDNQLYHDSLSLWCSNRKCEWISSCKIQWDGYESARTAWKRLEAEVKEEIYRRVRSDEYLDYI